METSKVVRHQKIQSLTAKHTEKAADSAIGLWEQAATQIISIVGEGGFDSLYARSMFLSRSTCPWLVATSESQQSDHRFVNLKTSLEGQTPARICEANSQLLITFTDILASLIGESLTAHILDSAWDHDAQETVGKEFKNE